ncbi:MAG: hypothetical protein ACW98Y_02300 [Candidatus Thorarchaeota archaeon]|jgi:hypothetical protein
MQIRGDGSHTKQEFRNGKSLFLGSEEIRFVAEEKSGFIVLSDRRCVYVKHDKKGYKISNVVPIDLVISCEHQKKDTWAIEFHKINDDGILKAKEKKGEVQFDIADFKIKHPENTDEVSYSSIMNEFNVVLKETLESSPFSDGTFQGRDYSYLEGIPDSVTRDGILHVNTILTDRPDEDALYGKAKSAFGDNPYILLRTLEYEFRRYLLVVGSKASMYVHGNYSYGSVSKMSIISLEPPQILNISSDWTKTNPNSFHISKPVQEYGEVKVKKFEFKWKPPEDDDVARVPWFNEPANAVWIIADMTVDKQKELLKANFGRGEETINHPKILQQRYY